jgi:hypothetical protein
MSNNNRYFRGQMEDEEVVVFSRKHWIVLLRDIVPFSLFVCCAVLIIYLLKLNKITLPAIDDFYFDSLILLVIGGSGYIIHRFFIHLINYFNTLIIITDLRIVEIRKTIFLHHIIESLDIRKIQDVEFKQEGLIKNLLKLGTIYITLGNSELKTISQIPNPDFHFRLLNKLKNEVFSRPQRSLNNKKNADSQKDNPDCPVDCEPKTDILREFVSPRDYIKSEE